MEFPFDEWSKAWHANKLRKSNCTVTYKCIAQGSNGAPCEKAASSKTKGGTCWNHRNYVKPASPVSSEVECVA